MLGGVEGRWLDVYFLWFCPSVCTLGALQRGNVKVLLWSEVGREVPGGLSNPTVPGGLFSDLFFFKNLDFEYVY